MVTQGEVLALYVRAGSNTSTETREIDMTQQALQEARDRLKATNGQLKQAIDELGLALANRNQQTRGKKYRLQSSRR